MWNPVVRRIEPRAETTAFYDELFAQYLGLYASTRQLAHELADRQREAS